MENEKDSKPMPTVENLTDLIEELHKVFESDRVDVDYVKALMTSYKSNPGDWKKYAKFDDFRYTRNLVDSGNGKFNLIALCWGEGQGSSIHDHMDAHCFMKILDGELTETSFAWPSSRSCSQRHSTDGNGSPVDDYGAMIETGCNCYKKDTVAYINDSLGLHRVENKSHTDPAVSLHLYSPPFDYCHTFDERTGTKNTAKVTFWSKYGERVSTEMSDVNECAAKKSPAVISCYSIKEVISKEQ